MRLKAVLLAIAALVIAAPAAAIDARLKLPVTLTKAQAIEEIDLVARILSRTHPGVYQYQSKKQFDRLVANTKAGVKGPVNAAQVYLDLAKIVESVCDSHTQVDFADDESRLIGSGFRAFGTGLASVEGKLYAPSAFGERPIASVDGIDDEEILAELRARLPVDACANREFALFDSVRSAGVLTAILGERSTYAFRFADAKEPDVVHRRSNPFSGVVMAVQVRQYLGNHQSELEKLGFDECTTVELNFLCRRAGDRITFLKFRSFNFDDSQNQIDRIFADILKQGDEHLILDLQDNRGGRLETMSYFLSYLLARSHKVADRVHRRSLGVEADGHFTWDVERNKVNFKKLSKAFKRAGRRNGVYSANIGNRAFGHPHFRGRITILVNESTASAAVSAASILRRQQKAVIVGATPAGSGGYSCAAPFGRYVLPHSRLVLRVPADCFSRGNSYLKGSKPLAPDIAVPVTADNMADYPLAVLKAALTHLGVPTTPPAEADQPTVFLVRNPFGVKTARDLNGASICFIGGSAAEKHLRRFSEDNDMVFEEVEVVDRNILESIYYQRKCEAAVATESQISDIRNSMRDPEEHVILPGNINTAVE